MCNPEGRLLNHSTTWPLVPACPPPTTTAVPPATAPVEGNLIESWVGGKSPEALAKGERLRARLSLMQIPLGIAGVVLAIYSLV